MEIVEGRGLAAETRFVSVTAWGACEGCTIERDSRPGAPDTRTRVVLPAHLAPHRRSAGPFAGVGAFRHFVGRARKQCQA